MKRLLYICAFWVCALLSGCDIVIGELLFPYDLYYKSFVLEYVDVDFVAEPTVRVENDCAWLLIPSTLYARQNVEGKDSAYALSQDEKHKALCVKNGDVNFDRKLRSSDGESGPGWLPEATVWNTDYPFSDITIVSDAGFDDLHPSGTPLDDIINIKYYTYRFYIENGYKHTDPERMYVSNDYSGDCVTKLLSEWGAEDFLFVQATNHPVYGGGLAFSFTSKPTIEQQHHMMGIISIEGNAPFVFEFDMDFGASE